MLPIQPTILKEISPGISLDGLMLSWNSSTLATSCKELTHWKNLWCWEGLGEGGKGDDIGWVGWIASPTRWTWVWVNSWRWWWTGRPGVLRFMGLQTVGHDWATELNWIELMILFHKYNSTVSLFSFGWTLVLLSVFCYREYSPQSLFEDIKFSAVNFKFATIFLHSSRNK